jgi:hypothetical protein
METDRKMDLWTTFVKNGFSADKTKDIITINKMSATKKSYDAIYALVTCLADNYGFDADAAMEVIESETEVNHIAILTDMVKPAKKTVEPKPQKEEAPKETESEDEKPDDGKKSPLEKTRHNVQLWTKKLTANKFKDEAAKQKHSEKLDKERKKLEKLEASETKPAPKAKPEKKEVAPAKEEKAKPEKKEKRIARWTKTNHDVHFKTALTAVSLEPSDELKKEFLKYVEDLTDDDWKKDGKTYADHMRDFAKLKAPVTKSEETEEAQPEVHRLPISDIKKIGMLTPIEKVGQYWDADNGRFVTGPAEDDDEDFGDPVKMGDKEYIIGERTGRVYEVRESGDVFAGFIGIGKFKELDM